MSKKSFKENIQGADKLFSANDSTEPEISENDAVNISSNILTNPETNINANIQINFLDSIFADIKEEPKGRNYTFYLSNEVATAITETAKKYNISNSKLVDILLKKVLLGDLKIRGNDYEK